MTALAANTRVSRVNAIDPSINTTLRVLSRIGMVCRVYVILETLSFMVSFVIVVSVVT